MPSYAGYINSPGNSHPRPTILTGTDEIAVLLEAQFNYTAVTAGVIRAFVKRYNANGATPTDRTEKHNTRSPAALSPANTWGTPPTVTGNALVYQDAGSRIGQLSNRWTPARPYAGIVVQNGEEIGTDDSTTTSSTTAQYVAWCENFPGSTRRIGGRRPRKDYWLYANYRASGAGLASSGRQRRNIACHYLLRGFYHQQRSIALDAAGGTTTPQALSATVTATTTITNQVGKILSATATSTASIVKSAGKAVSGTATSTASIVKSVGKALSATATTTATISPIKVILVSLSATVTSTATMVRGVGKLLSATVTTTAAIANSVGKTISATATSTATIAKSIAIRLSATATSTADMLATFVIATLPLALQPLLIKLRLRPLGPPILRPLEPPPPFPATVFDQILSATVSTTATIIKSVGRSLAATATSSASVVKSIGKSITATTVTTTATLLASKTLLKTLTATATATATISRSVGKVLSATVTSTASIVKQVALRLSAAVTSVASLVADPFIAGAVVVRGYFSNYFGKQDFDTPKPPPSPSDIDE